MSAAQQLFKDLPADFPGAPYVRDFHEYIPKLDGDYDFTNLFVGFHVAVSFDNIL
jgi:hypothetical protein